jgi:hypothetical protein
VHGWRCVVQKMVGEGVRMLGMRMRRRAEHAGHTTLLSMMPTVTLDAIKIPSSKALR